MHNTAERLLTTDFPAIRRGRTEILQVNLGYLCNLSCTHCHVNAGPKRTELASKQTIEDILTFIEKQDIRVLDITGGAPEMNPYFRELVVAARKMSVKVIDRCNLTILNEPGYEDLADFLVEYQVQVSASLPCYSEQNVQEQRGKGVFLSSIDAIRKLNALGYGKRDDLVLDLVYNPNGAFLPPNQQSLQQQYKDELWKQHQLVFNDLLTITNMPISRFGSMLMSKGIFDDYMKLLRDNYSEDNLDGVMCRSLISVDWQGFVYDCDFNQMLAWPMPPVMSVIASDKKRLHLRDIIEQNIEESPIRVGEHCYGCTAGQGSSCGGALGE